MATAKVFWPVRSQAVILEPIATDWTWLDALAATLDDDFRQAVDERPEEQERPALDCFD